jgi:hypothetical protein
MLAKLSIYNTCSLLFQHHTKVRLPCFNEYFVSDLNQLVLEQKSVKQTIKHKHPKHSDQEK